MLLYKYIVGIGGVNIKSRMDKYYATDKTMERTKKNSQLYEEVYDDLYRNQTYTNMTVIDSAKEININKLKNILDEREKQYDTRQYRTMVQYPEIVNEQEETEAVEEKLYDINLILDNAKNNRKFIEDAREKEKLGKACINLEQDAYENLVKDEKEVMQLVNTLSMGAVNPNDDCDDLLKDLKASDNTIITAPIKSDMDHTNLKSGSFYTDSLIFTKNDFDDFQKLNTQLKKGKLINRLIIMFITLFVIIGLLYVGLKYYKCI